MNTPAIDLKWLATALLALLLAGNALAEDDAGGGDAFRKAAAEYEAKAEYYADEELYEISERYARMAEIKAEAADLADDGFWEEIDWSEYKELEHEILQLKHAARLAERAKRREQRGE